MRKRTFDVLRLKLLTTFASGQKTVNQAATEAGINWKTVDNHITFLLGKGFLKPVFVSPYVKIYEITDVGQEELRTTKLSTTNLRKPNSSTGLNNSSTAPSRSSISSSGSSTASNSISTNVRRGAR